MHPNAHELVYRYEHVQEDHASLWSQHQIQQDSSCQIPLDGNVPTLVALSKRMEF